MDFFLAFYDLMANDLLVVVEDYIKNGRISGALNAPFIALIPMELNPSPLIYFYAISLCNLVYKLISKMSANQLKEALF